MEFESPYTDKPKNNTISYLFFAFVVVVLLLLVVSLIKRIRIQGEDYNQRQTHQHFNHLHGDFYDEEAKETINYGEMINNPRAIDHYRLGTAYLISANNPRRAHQHFRQALDQIIEGKVEIKEAPFIIDRIDDYKNRFVNITDIEDLPIKIAMLAYFNNARDMMRN